MDLRCPLEPEVQKYLSIRHSGKSLVLSNRGRMKAIIIALWGLIRFLIITIREINLNISYKPIYLQRFPIKVSRVVFKSTGKSNQLNKRFNI